MKSDLDLLGQYARTDLQDAFAELVRRHVDLVYSAALRQVRSPQLAEEIVQSVFTDLARNAGKMSGTGVLPVGSLTPWLYAVTRRTAIDVIRKESRRQLREQIAVEMNKMNATAENWTQIEPLLDEAMHALDDTDRNAVLLRYFENKSLREVGEALGASEDAAQKRVSRAVERLREFFSKRNVKIGTGGLAAMISANAIQAAPAGLAATISTAAVLAGTAVKTSIVIAATKAIAMTTFQKTLITITLTAAIGTGIYQARQASTMRGQVQMLQQQQAPLTEQIQQLQRERADATNRLVLLAEETAEMKSNSTELLRLRGEVTRLERDSQELARLKPKLSKIENAKADQMKKFRELQKREALTTLQRMKEYINLTPDQEQALQDVLLKRADLIAQDVQALTDGNESQESREQFSQSMSNLTAQVDALISPEQKADYQALQRSGAKSAARVHADGELMMMQNLVGIRPEQEAQIYDVLYSFALKQKPEDPVDNPEKVEALTTVLTPAQMEQYRKFMQGKRMTTQITYPTE